MYILDLFISVSSAPAGLFILGPVLMNLVIYFFLGYAIDYILSRLRK